MNMNEQLMTEVDVAKMLKINVGTVRNWRSRGEGPHYVKLGNKTVRYRPADINDWLKESKA